MKVGIAIDSRKRPIFEKRLKNAGYTFTADALTGNTLLLRVDTENAEALRRVVALANEEAGVKP